MIDPVGFFTDLYFAIPSIVSLLFITFMGGLIAWQQTNNKKVVLITVVVLAFASALGLLAFTVLVAGTLGH
jgi:hypothetical protein